MRWLLLKDLQILRRSPLLVGLLIVYPIVISLLVGLAIDRPPQKPKVAFANLVPTGESEFSIGGKQLDVADYAPQLFEEIEPVRVKTREEAIAKVRDGEVLGAMVIPADAAERLRSTLGLGGGDPPQIEVYYNASDPLKKQLVQSTITSALAEANDALSDAVLKEAAGYIDVIVTGGEVALPLVGSVDILGLRRAQTIIEAAVATLPKDAPERIALTQVARFARLAADNLDVSKPILATIGSPVDVKQTNVSGATSSLGSFFVAVAVTVSLMFVALLLAAGLLALEREQHAFGRLVRGLVSPDRAAVGEGAAGRALLARGLPADAVRPGGPDRPGLGARARVARGAAGGRARLRGHGHRDRRAHARGPGRLAARVRAVAPDRVPRARPVRGGRRDAVQGDRRRLGAVPVQAGAGGARRRDLRRRPRRAAGAPARAHRSRFAALARLALRRFA